MTTYRCTDDGMILHADSPLHLIEQLRDDCRTETEDVEDFMLRMSNWCDAAGGLTIRIETPEAFVADLLDGGVIEVIADDAE
jgi:hypothetical protein